MNKHEIIGGIRPIVELLACNNISQEHCLDLLANHILALQALPHGRLQTPAKSGIYEIRFRSTVLDVEVKKKRARAYLTNKRGKLLLTFVVIPRIAKSDATEFMENLIEELRDVSEVKQKLTLTGRRLCCVLSPLNDDGVLYPQGTK